MISTFQKEFEDKILELGHSFSRQQGGFYVLYDKIKNYFLTVRLMISQQPNSLIYGSKNGIDIHSIGLFWFKQSLFDQGPEFYIFMFHNSNNQRIDYLIISNSELTRRLKLRTFVTERKKSFRLVFWLMSEGSIYNATNISPEGEWFYLSQGVGGRIAEGTYMDFTTFLNSWGQLKF